ncbi:DNA-binding protein Fis [Ralstonia solanacearum Po82]|nr:DNA-binding protein Fis [Ralstonia solanacearum Po82]
MEEREDHAARQSHRRGRADRRADRRRRADDDGRGRALQRRPRRADHRHQHGLPGQESVQRGGGLGPAAERAAGGAHRRGGGRRGGRPRAGHAQDPHRLGPRAPQRAHGGAHRAGGRHQHADRARPHPRRPVPRRGRVRDHRRGQGFGTHPGGRQRRHRHAGQGQAGAGRDRRRRHHDRPRRAGATVAVPRDRALPADRHAAAGAGGGRDPRHHEHAPGRALRVLRRIHRRAHRAQAHRLVHAGAGGRQPVPPPHEHHRRHGRATGRGQCLLRRAARAVRPPGLRGPGPCRGRPSHDGQQRQQQGTACRMSRNPIERCIRDSLDTYYRDLDGENPSNVYDMVLQAIERPLLETVMEWASNNQSLAADYLGINRNTLRKKLQQHGLL